MRRWLVQESGSSAVEFALVLPLFLLLTLGVIHLSLMMFAASNMHATVEVASRCWALADTNCTTKAMTETYAASFYKGAASSASFTATDETTTASLCGWKVHGQATYVFTAVLLNVSVPISADACFPKLS